MKPGVTAVLVAFHNEERALTRVMRDLLPALRLAAPLVDTELVVVDNSVARLGRLAEVVEGNGVVPGRYCWNGGENLGYGPSLNRAATLAQHAHLVYLCAAHGRMHDPTYLLDLLAPMLDDAAGEVAMCGTLAPSGPPSALGFSDSLPWQHVQGGVFAARTPALLAHPYPAAGSAFAHWGSDLFVSLDLVAAGHRLVEVPTVLSLWRARAGSGWWKYVHDEDN